MYSRSCYRYPSCCLSAVYTPPRIRPRRLAGSTATAHCRPARPPRAGNGAAAWSAVAAHCNCDCRMPPPVPSAAPDRPTRREKWSPPALVCFCGVIRCCRKNVSRKSCSECCSSTSTVSAVVMHPLQAKQSARRAVTSCVGDGGVGVAFETGAAEAAAAVETASAVVETAASSSIRRAAGSVPTLSPSHGGGALLAGNDDGSAVPFRCRRVFFCPIRRGTTKERIHAGLRQRSHKIVHVLIQIDGAAGGGGRRWCGHGGLLQNGRRQAPLSALFRFHLLETIQNLFQKKSVEVDAWDTTLPSFIKEKTTGSAWDA